MQKVKRYYITIYVFRSSLPKVFSKKDAVKQKENPQVNNQAPLQVYYNDFTDGGISKNLWHYRRKSSSSRKHLEDCYSSQKSFKKIQFTFLKRNFLTLKVNK